MVLKVQRVPAMATVSTPARERGSGEGPRHWPEVKRCESPSISGAAGGGTLRSSPGGDAELIAERCPGRRAQGDEPHIDEDLAELIAAVSCWSSSARSRSSGSDAVRRSIRISPSRWKRRLGLGGHYCWST